jgi:XTP/dITP diphosphohydrolase
MGTVVIATRNAHKVAEIQAILGENFRYLTLNDFPDAPPVVEDTNSFAGNAVKKAVEIAKWLSESSVAGHRSGITGPTFALADDSGLEVDTLNGAPGVHSARFAALDTGNPRNSSDADNRSKLLRLLRDVPAEKRTARFRCALALTPVVHLETGSASPVCLADESELRSQVFEGICEGRIGLKPKGQGGFGYDSLFIPDGYEQTFAELGEAVKNKMSHRAKALAKLKESLR